MTNTEIFIMRMFLNRKSISPKSRGLQLACENLREKGFVRHAGWIAETSMEERRRRYAITTTGYASSTELDI